MYEILDYKDGNPVHGGRAECLFSSQAWLDTLGAAFGFDLKVLRLPGHDLPFADIRDVIGKRLVSLPFTDFLCFSPSPTEVGEALDRLETLYPEHALAFRFARSDLEECGARADGFHHVVPLDCEAGVEKGFSSNFRRNMHKAERAGVVAEVSDDIDSMRRFHRLLVLHRAQKFGVLTPPWQFFESLQENFVDQGKGFVVEALADGELCASALVLCHNDMAHYKFGASDMATLALRPNNILFPAMMREACARKCAVLDLGLSWASKDDAGLRRFKEEMGGRPESVSFFKRWPDKACADRMERRREVFRDLTQYILTNVQDVDALDDAGRRLFHLFT